MLVRSVREYEDLIYFRKYSSEQEKKEIEQVIENLKRQIHASGQEAIGQGQIHEIKEEDCSESTELHQDHIPIQAFGPRAEESQKDEEVHEN